MTPGAVAGTRRSMKELVDGTIRVQIDIDPPHRADFLRLFPSIDMPVALAPLALNTPREQDAAGSQAAHGDKSAMPGNGEGESRAPNELARTMMAGGYFRNPRLWLAMHDSGIYTAQMHFKWLATIQNCARAAVEDFGCKGDVITHHCPAANAIPGGTRQPEAPRKPLHFYGLRLCDGHHTWAHTSTGASREDKERMLSEAVALSAERLKSQANLAMNIESLREITQAMLTEFEQRIGL